MRIVEIVALENGAHRNQTTDGVMNTIPEGWAIVPEDMETPNFPFGEVEAAEVDGAMVVTKWTAGTIPEPEPEPEPVEPETDGVTWDAMAAAITEGVNEV